MRRLEAARAGVAKLAVRGVENTDRASGREKRDKCVCSKAPLSAGPSDFWFSSILIISLCLNVTLPQELYTSGYPQMAWTFRTTLASLSALVRENCPALHLSYHFMYHVDATFASGGQ